jgi:hypothetical protein
VSLPGLTGQSSIPGRRLLDRQSKSDASDFDHLVSAEVGQARLRLKPGDDKGIKLIGNALACRYDKSGFLTETKIRAIWKDRSSTPVRLTQPYRIEDDTVDLLGLPAFFRKSFRVSENPRRIGLDPGRAGS